MKAPVIPQEPVYLDRWLENGARAVDELDPAMGKWIRGRVRARGLKFCLYCLVATPIALAILVYLAGAVVGALG